MCDAQGDRSSARNQHPPRRVREPGAAHVYIDPIAASVPLRVFSILAAKGAHLHMTQGRISRASLRYPDARRRAARYGQTRFGQRGRPLAPHLMPAITGRDRKARFLGGPAAILSILGVFLGVFAIVFILLTIISAALGVTGTMAAYREVNKDLPNAAQIAVNTFQTTR